MRTSFRLGRGTYRRAKPYRSPHPKYHDSLVVALARVLWWAIRMALAALLLPAMFATALTSFLPPMRWACRRLARLQAALVVR